MSGFNNILVGVDLSQFTPGTAKPTEAAQGLIQRALWLASKNTARLTFFSALHMPEGALLHLDDPERSRMVVTIQEAARQVHADLVTQAKKQGIVATGQLAFGPGWLELIRQVLRGQHDLLLVGTRDRHGLQRMLFGSTALKLLRRCPCPVWVTKSAVHGGALKILVASDLSAVSQSALRLAVCLAQVVDAELHVLHVVDYPLDHLWSAGLPDATTLKYHHSVRATAERVLNEQIEEAGCRKIAPQVEVHLEDGGGLPDPAILDFIHKRQIELLVMGTIARGGIPGIMIGNTAERLLPEVPCSVLAVKPSDFKSPVTLD